MEQARAAKSNRPRTSSASDIRDSGRRMSPSPLSPREMYRSFTATIPGLGWMSDSSGSRLPLGAGDGEGGESLLAAVVRKHVGCEGAVTGVFHHDRPTGGS